MLEIPNVGVVIKILFLFYVDTRMIMSGPQSYAAFNQSYTLTCTLITNKSSSDMIFIKRNTTRRHVVRFMQGRHDCEPKEPSIRSARASKFWGSCIRSSSMPVHMENFHHNIGMNS